MKKVLFYSDWFLAGTGFGVVSKYVMNALQQTGKYEIDQLAINYDGQFFDRHKFPYQVSPARLKNPKDPYGTTAFLESYANGNYDYVWIMNDSFVVESFAQRLPEVQERMRQAGKSIPKLVYYLPIDAHLLPEHASLARFADKVVAYTEFGKQEILKTLPEIEGKLSVINHGTDPMVFMPVPEQTRRELRAKLLRIEDPDTFLWFTLNRNSRRKDLAKSILAFSEFKKLVPNSKFYLHTAIKDTDLNLEIAARDAGLSKEDILFPANYSAKKPVPVEVLNMLYNCGNAFLTNNLGEGWGLSDPDAMLVKMPVVGPNTTVYPERLDEGNRGYMFECKEPVYIDNSGFRYTPRLDDLVAKMLECYEEVKSGAASEKVERAYQYALSINWNVIGEQWVELFSKLEQDSPSPKRKVGQLL